MHPAGAVCVGFRLRPLHQLLQLLARLEVFAGFRELGKHLPRRRVAPVDPFLFPLGVGDDLGLSARPVKVQIRVEIPLIERVDAFGVLSGKIEL